MTVKMIIKLTRANLALEKELKTQKDRITRAIILINLLKSGGNPISPKGADHIINMLEGRL